MTPKLYKYRCKILKAYKYNNGTEMVPADKIQTLVDVNYIAESRNSAWTKIATEHTDFFQLGDTVNIELLHVYRWYHKFIGWLLNGNI